MKTEVKSPAVVAAVIAFVLLLGYFGFRYMNSVGSLDHGQVSYTPGVPPWLEKDPTKRGPAGLGNHTPTPNNPTQ